MLKLPKDPGLLTWIALEIRHITSVMQTVIVIMAIVLIIVTAVI
jgi:hypothetical protein